MREKLTKEMREFVPILVQNGYHKVRSNGSHWIYVNSQTHQHISVNVKLNRMVKVRLIKENNLEV